MRRSLFGMMVLFILLGFLPQGVSAAKFLPVKDLRAGMKGYAKSVFHGTRIETFPVTVLGVVRKRLGEADMIIVRLDGGYCVEHKCGIIAGMSGSPVYVGGRLIGAISYGWSFSIEPIAGVTPIEKMLEDAEGAGAKSDIAESGERRLSSPVVVRGKKYTRVRLLYSCPAVRGEAMNGTLVMSPVRSLFTISGFGEKGFQSLKSALARYGAVSVEGAAGENIPPARPDLVPGAALGVQLLKGDLSVSATGTLTWRGKDRILAFGHPMLQMGDVSLPMVSAYIHNILPSYLTSFKMASPLEVVGTLTLDRLYAVSGNLHQPPPMIPVTLNISDRSLKRHRTYHLLAASHPVLTRFLVEGALMEAVVSTSAFSGNSTAKISYRVEAEGCPPLLGQDFLFSPGLDEALAFRFGDVLARLMDNPFQPLKLRRLSLTAEIEQKKNVAVLEKISIPSGKYRPGDAVPVQIWLKPFGRSPVKKEITFTIPRNIKKGEIKIGVCGGSGAEQMKKKLFISQFPPTSLKQLLKQIREREKNSQVVARIVLPSEGAVLRSELFPFLPQSAFSIFSSSASSEIDSERDYMTFLLDTPWYIIGEAQVGIKVQQPSEQENQPEHPPEQKTSAGWPGAFRALKVEASNASAGNKKKEPAGAEPRAKTQSPPGTKKWDMGGVDLFESGFPEGISCSSRGDLFLAPALNKLFRSDEPLIWSLAFDPKRDRVYAGTGSGGQILRMNSQGKAISSIETGEALVSALALDEDGNLFAGTSPGGKIFEVTPEGRVTLFWESKNTYIWDLKFRRGELFAATGGKGKVFRLNRQGQASLVFESPEEHLLSLALGGAGEIFAGSAGSGIIYEIKSTGDARPILTCSSPSVDSLVLSPDGDLYAASGDKIYILFRDGRRKTLAAPGKSLFRLFLAGDGTLYAASGSGGQIFKIASDGTFSILYSFREAQTLSLAQGSGGAILFSTGGDGAVYEMGSCPQKSGTLTSNVFDCALQAHWGNLRWEPVLFPGTSISVQTRSGNTPFPDSSWSTWSQEYKLPSGSPIGSPPGRFIQCLLTLKGTGESSPVLSGASLFYREETRPPAIAWNSPSGGERWSGKKTLRLDVSTYDRSAFTFDLSCSKDDGKSWKALVHDLPLTWLENSESKGFPRAEFEWKTSDQPDGKYLLKLEARSRRNPKDQFLQAVCISETFIICNTEPEISIISQKKGEDSFEIRGQVISPLVNIAAVCYQIGEEEWREASPEDGIYDSPKKNFIVSMEGLQRRKAEIKIKATDEAGNFKILKRVLEK